MNKHLTAALFAALAWPVVAAPPHVERATVMMSDLPKGALTVERRDDGSRHITFQFRDRGRGPDLVTDSKADAAGVPTNIDISGTDYRHLGVAEQFSRQDGVARWKSNIDFGTSSTRGFYLPSQATEEDRAALARALLMAPDHSLPLLPSGTARIEKAEDRQVTGKAGSITATLYLISGLDLQPVPIWLDGDHELFAAGTTWLGVIREGYEDGQRGLLAAQEAALAKAAQQRTGTLRQHPSGPVLIRHARVFDAEHRRLIDDSAVLLRGDRIMAVEREGQIKVPRDARIVDAKGLTLLPGLWDMHVHLLGQSDGPLSLAAGITTVRDMGNDIDTLKALVDKFDSGALVGPHVIKAGLIDGRGPFAGPTKVLVSTPDEMHAAIARYAALGYPMIKLYSSVDPKLVPLAVADAHARGLRVGGHTPAGMTTQQVIDDGFNEVSHANFWLLSQMSPEVIARTNTPARFTDAYTMGWKIDAEGPAVRAFVDDLKAHHATVDPTLVTFEQMFTGEKGKLDGWIAPWTDRLPAVVLRDGRTGGRGQTPEQLKTYRESYHRMMQILGALNRAGVAIVPGTDGSALTFSRELELHVASGILPAQVLYEATLGAARVMKLDHEVGSITPGKRADLVLVDGDPTRDIGAVRRVRLVVKSGDLYDGAALAAAAGLQPASATSR